MYKILKKYELKNVVIILAMFLVCDMIYMQLEKAIVPESKEKMEYPIWSFIQMGINEEEFGFQNSTHSTEWKFEDVTQRIKDLGVVRLGKLLCKKQFWLWTEGTYQVSRYAFGAGAQEQMYYYETPLTDKVINPETSKIRKALDYLMKGQYFVLALLSLIDLIIKDKKDKRDLLLYLMIGLFCFYTIWEMKSRYILCLYPVFLILASSGLNKIMDKLYEIKNS